MKALVWSSAFVRAFKRATKRDPALKDRTEAALRQLAEDPFHPSLHSHKLNVAESQISANPPEALREFLLSSFLRLFSYLRFSSPHLKYNLKGIIEFWGDVKLPAPRRTQ